VNALADSNIRALDWIGFLRRYGPVPQNENMYDEFIRRSAARAGVEPLHFDHPARAEVLKCFGGSAPISVVLTGTAGDGKTHLCRQVWEEVGGDAQAWQSASPYLSTTIDSSGGGAGARTLHIIRDLSAWAPQRGAEWDSEREAVLQRFSATVFGHGTDGAGGGANGTADHTADLFLIAANDGQLIESWHRLGATPGVLRAREHLETLLVEDQQQLPGASLQFFNLSRGSSAALFDRAVAAFLGHSGWDECRRLSAGVGAFYGPDCPIRRNVELLASPLVQARLRALLALCDYSCVHIPIRQILLLLTNAVLGHPGVKDRLMRAADVPKVVREGTAARASLYSNIFGGNLTDTRRESTLVFEALDRFGIGHETTNRVDNILIYGQADETVRPYFDRFMAADPFYGADPSFRAAQREYVEGADEDDQRSAAFLRALVAQRRGLFFKIPDEEAEDLRLWELTVFRFAGEYLERVVGALNAGRRVDRPVVSRLVKGLNRVFTGMLLANDRDLLLATSIAFSHGRVSRLLEERISVEPRLGERVDVVAADGAPTLEVTLDPTRVCHLPLHLTRYEFLSRVAEGALPSSFSKECYEDILAFKSRVLTALGERRRASGEERSALAFQVLEVDEGGKAAVLDLEVLGV
jgi:hypothetical protein